MTEIEKKYEEILMQEAERKEKQRQASANWYHRNAEIVSQKRKEQYKLKPKVKKERTASMKAKQTAYYVANKDQILNQRKAAYDIRKKIPLTAEQLAVRKQYRDTHK